MKKIKNAVKNVVGIVKKKSKKSSSSPLLEGIKNLASNVIKSNSALTGVASIVKKAVNLAKPIIAKNAKQDQAKGKIVEVNQIEKQYKNALKSRKGNATQWTLKDGTKCFFAVDAHGNIMDYSSIWFTTKDGKTFRIFKTQCVTYKGISKSSNDIGASLGNPIYKKVEGLNVLKAFIEILLTPISKIAASFLVYVIENMICNLTVVFDIVKLIVALDVKGLLQLVDTMALYLVGYNIVLFMLGTIIGLTSGVALAIAVAFGTAIFMILIDLAQIGFNLDLYMEQRGIDSYEELTGYFLAQVAEDAVYNFLLVNFMKFAKKAKIKIPSKVSNGVNKLNDKIKDAANTVANKLDDMINAAKVDKFIKNNVNPNFQKNVKKAFTSDAKVTVLTEDIIVYRYHGGDSNVKSYWYTPKKTSNPGADLALPKGNAYTQVDKFVIPKGTEVLEGTVAPNFGQPGGGYQIYVPDPSVVRKY